MNEYLAWQAATAGGLLGHLLVDEVDDELLLAAADILHALIEGARRRTCTTIPTVPRVTDEP